MRSCVLSWLNFDYPEVNLFRRNRVAKLVLFCNIHHCLRWIVDSINCLHSNVSFLNFLTLISKEENGYIIHTIILMVNENCQSKRFQDRMQLHTK